MVSLLLAVIYLAFISLGLPDALLGSAWPVMQGALNAPLSFAGAVSMVISGGTILSSLLSDRMTRKLGAGLVTALSVLMTAAALLGFSLCSAPWMLILWAVPYGLGAGAVDAALNNYVALHYSSRHMSWLHCMWGVGAASGPYIMGAVITGGGTWNGGYRCIAIIQIVLTAVLLCSLPLWKGPQVQDASGSAVEAKTLSVKEVLQLRGVKNVLICFFCYCALEQTTGLWASSYLTLYKGVPAEMAASFASMFFIGITAGRALNGFLAMKLSDVQMVRMGQGLIACGIIVMLLPLGAAVSLAGFVLIGLGCAPVYPCLIHATPAHFGADKSQAVIGIQMACAYVGTSLMPPLFGLIAAHITVSLLPAYLLALLALMTVMHERLLRRTAH